MSPLSGVEEQVGELRPLRAQGVGEVEGGAAEEAQGCRVGEEDVAVGVGDDYSRGRGVDYRLEVAVAAAGFASEAREGVGDAVESLVDLLVGGGGEAQ